jgi:cellulose synthase/poly-beta-1,6-N-acetylglucosamine synthase-like glycosyltransferase
MSAWLVLFVASLATLAYTFAGYPALLYLRARLRPRPVARAPFAPPVAIVIVVHNGESHVVRKIESCLAQDYPAEQLRVVVASDGSTDATNRLLRALDGARVSLLAFPSRRGKAACINDAIAACHEPFVVMTDVRQPLDPGAVRALMENMADERVAVASGKLVNAAQARGAMGGGLDAYLRYEQALRRLESAGGSLVGVTGALYALRRECFRPIPPDTVLDDMLVPLNALRGNRRVVFEERAVAFETLAAEPAHERARRIRTLAGNFQLLASRPDLVLPWRNPVAFELVSHKVLRLAGPLLMLAALASNVALAAYGTLFAALLAAHLAFYAAAFAAAVSPRVARWRVAALARAFVFLNFYVVLGAWEFSSNREVHLWKPSHAQAGAPD